MHKFAIPSHLARAVTLALLTSAAALPFTAVAADWTVMDVQPSVQTPALTEEDADADADDPAIYVDAANIDGSFVVTAVKNGGIRVYDFGGQLLQSILPIEDSRITMSISSTTSSWPTGPWRTWPSVPTGVSISSAFTA